jgi:hypothetical protein
VVKFSHGYIRMCSSNRLFGFHSMTSYPWNVEKYLRLFREEGLSEPNHIWE